MDLRDLAPLYQADGPFVTVVLDTGSAVEDAAARLEVSWKNVSRELEERGVDSTTREALAAAVGEHGQGGSRVLVAAGGRVRLAISLPEPPESEIVDVGPLPRLLPLAERTSLQLPYVVVQADRTGADVLAYGGSADTPAEAIDVTGPSQDRTSFGSHRRVSHGAEEAWERNAGEVASAVDAAATDVSARLVVGAGDEHALSLLEGHLSERLKPLWTTVAGGRSDDGGAAHLAQHVTDAVADRLGAETDDLLAKYQQERGQADKGVDGPADTLAALRMAQVDVLIVTTELPDDATAWYGADPATVGASREDVAGLGEPDPQQGPLVDVLLRAAIGTAATVRVVPGDRPDAPQHGVGALLRFPVADTTVA